MLIVSPLQPTITKIQKNKKSYHKKLQFFFKKLNNPTQHFPNTLHLPLHPIKPSTQLFAL